MTDDEEREAELSAEKFVSEYVTMNGRPPHRPDVMAHCYTQGYAAGLDANTAELKRKSEHQSKEWVEVVAELKTERARSDRLIDKLRAVRVLDSWYKKWQVIDDAIAEYEANK